MPTDHVSFFERLSYLFPRFRRNARAAQGRTQAEIDGLHYLDEDKNFVCRCQNSSHFDKRRVENIRVQAQAAAFFRAWPNKFRCNEFQREPYDRSQPRLQEHSADTEPPENTFTEEELQNLMLVEFHEAMARGLSPVRALMETERILYSSTGMLFEQSDFDALLLSLSASADGAFHAAQETGASDSVRSMDHPPFTAYNQFANGSIHTHAVPESQTERFHHDWPSQPREHSRGNSVDHQRAQPTYGHGHPIPAQPVQSYSEPESEEVPATPFPARTPRRYGYLASDLAPLNRESAGPANVVEGEEAPITHTPARTPQRYSYQSSELTLRNRAVSSSSSSSISRERINEEQGEEVPTIHPPAQMPPVSGYLAPDLAPLNRESAGSDKKVDEAKADCLHMILTMFPEIEIDYVLALINAMVSDNANARVNAENIIDQLLENPSGCSDEPLIAPINGRAGARSAEEDPESLSSSQSGAGDREYHVEALESLTTPWDDPWREIPVESTPTASDPCHQGPAHGSSPPLAAPPRRQFTGPDLSFVTCPTHNAWSESPETTNSPGDSPLEDRRVSQFRSWGVQTAPSFERPEAVQPSSALLYQPPVTADSEDSNSDPDVFVRSSPLPDPFSSHETEITRVRESPATPPSRSYPSSSSRRLRNKAEAYDIPGPPIPYRRKDVRNARDTSPSARIAERRSTRRPFSPVNIDGGWEHVDAREATYGGDVSADLSGNPWVHNSRSFAPPASSQAQGSPAPERSDQRQRVGFESPPASSRYNPAADTSSESEDDAAPPLRYTTYQGSPERRKNKQQPKGDSRFGP